MQIQCRRWTLVQILPSLNCTDVGRLLGVDTFGVRVDLQAFLCHLSITQEVQRHPDKVALNAVKLFLDLLQRPALVNQMALLVLFIVELREEFLVVLECSN